MKHLFSVLLTTILCATASAQTIRTLGYNSTNGQIVAATNIVWTNSFNFSTNTVAAQVRTNLSLGWSALTNTNSSYGLVGFATNGTIVVGNTNTNTITITNPIVLSGTADITTPIGLGATLGYFRVVGNTNTNTWALSYDGSNYFSEFLHNGSQLIRLTSTNINYSVPIIFSADSVATDTRTNLGLGLAALTNTNNANFISDLGALATNGNAAGLTNFPTVATASNVTGVVDLTNGGSGATNAQNARSNFFGHGGISTNISVVGTNNTNTLVFTNGLLMEVQ